MSRNDDSNRTDCFKKLFKAHSIIADISEKINALYTSATSISPLNDGMPKSNGNTQRFEGIMVEIIYLKELAQSLLKRRAIFDMFFCSLSPIYQEILSMRCEECRPWKEIADELNMSSDTVQRMFKRICEKAEGNGLFDTTKSGQSRNKQ